MSPHRRVLRRACRCPSLLVGLVLVGLYGLLALVGPAIAPHDPLHQEIARKLEPASVTHPLGLDELGRDMLSRILHGGRYTLGMASAAVALAMVVGITLGGLAGYHRGWLDALILRVVDGMLAFPGLILAMAVVSVLGRGSGNLVVAVGVAAVPGFIRLVRGEFLSLTHEEYVTAAHAVGVPSGRIIVRHLLPNALAPILVQGTYAVAGAILSASGLSFLGLGAQPPTPEWAVMLSRGRDYMFLAPHVITIPGLFIAIAILGLNLLGDGLRDVFDPRLVD